MKTQLGEVLGSVLIRRSAVCPQTAAATMWAGDKWSPCPDCNRRCCELKTTRAPLLRHFQRLGFGCDRRWAQPIIQCQSLGQRFWEIRKREPGSSGL